MDGHVQIYVEWICICIYMYIHVCMCMCLYIIYMYTYIHVYIYLHTDTHTHTHTHTHTCTHAHMHMIQVCGRERTRCRPCCRRGTPFGALAPHCTCIRTQTGAVQFRLNNKFWSPDTTLHVHIHADWHVLYTCMYIHIDMCIFMYIYICV